MLQLPAGREAIRGERAPRYERHRPERTLLYQLSVLDISRSSAYRKPAGVNDEDVDLMQRLDALHLRHPFKGSRRLRDDLWDGLWPSSQSQACAAPDEANGYTCTASGRQNAPP